MRSAKCSLNILQNQRHMMKLSQRNCFMACIDLKDAYYSIPIRVNDRKLNLPVDPMGYPEGLENLQKILNLHWPNYTQKGILFRGIQMTFTCKGKHMMNVGLTQLIRCTCLQNWTFLYTLKTKAGVQKQMFLVRERIHSRKTGSKLNIFMAGMKHVKGRPIAGFRMVMFTICFDILFPIGPFLSRVLPPYKTCVLPYLLSCQLS